MNFKDLISIRGGRTLNQIDSHENNDLVSDSQSISLSGKNSFLIAIQDKKHDGYQFIKTLYNKGIRSLLVEKNTDPKFKLEANTRLSLLK